MRSRQVLVLACVLVSAAACVPTDPPGIQAGAAAVDFGAVRNGQLARRPLRLENTGGRALSVETAVLPAAGHAERAGWFEVQPPRLVVAPGASAELTVLFSPSASQDAAALLVLATNAPKPDDVVTVALAGVGQGADDVVLEPAALDFGAVPLGESRTASVELANRGALPVRTQVTPIAGDGAVAYDLAPDTYVLHPGEHRTLQVSFTPLEAEPYPAMLEIDLDGERRTLSLTGLGGAPVLVVTPARVDFGLVELGGRSAREVTFRNVGTVALQLELALEGAVGEAPPDPAFVARAPAGPVEVPAGEALTATVEFVPEALGAFVSALAWSSDDVENPVGRVELVGLGGGADVRLTPDPLDFGWVGVGGPGAVRRLRVENGGSAPLHLSGVRVDGAGFSAEPPAVTEVAPGGHVEVAVTFLPTAPRPHAGRVFVLTDDPDSPEAAVALQGTGTDAAGCRAQVAPDPLDFGLVPVGETRTLTLSIVAPLDAGAPCLVSVDPPIGDGFELPEGPVTGRVLDPGQRLLVPVALRADRPGDLLSGRLPVWTGTEELEVTLAGETSFETPGLVFSPSRLDFGEVAPLCRRNMELCVWNVGPIPRNILGARVVDVDERSAFKVERDFSNQLGPGQAACFILGFYPAREGEHAASLEILTYEFGWHSPFVLQLQGRGSRPGAGHEAFTQGPASAVDVLFVVDDSGSLWARHDTAQSFPVLQQLAAGSGTDYRAAIVSTDTAAGGAFHHAPGEPAVVTPLLPDPAATFAANMVGSAGSSVEQPLHSTFLALGEGRPEANEGFLRDGAVLSVVVVTDEEDQSPWPMAAYRDFLWDLRPRNELSVSALAAPGASCSGQCGTAEGGPRLGDLVRQTGGRLTSICICRVPGDWERLYRRVLGVRDTFVISGQPRTPWFGADGRPGTSDDNLIVRIRGADSALRPARGWTWDPALNAVVFEPLYQPEPGESVDVTWTPACNR